MQIDKLPAIEFMVSAPTLGEDIARRLRLLIHSGALSPGDRCRPSVNCLSNSKSVESVCEKRSESFRRWDTSRCGEEPRADRSFRS